MGIAAIKMQETGMVVPKRSEGERCEPSRSGGTTIPGTTSQPGGSCTSAVDPEVSTKAVRRRFSAAYKLRILQEADGCNWGEISALLRREGLYSTHLTVWRRQRESGEIAGLEPRKRGKKPVPRNPLTVENERLRRENRRLEKRLRQAETIIDVQKKLCDVLGLTVPPIELNEDDE
jgi:transposase